MTSLKGKSWELDKICRVCLLSKKNMKPLFEELVASMLMDFAKVAIENTDGWPDKICIQCVHQVSRCHAFKKRVEKSDQELRNYIKTLTVVEETVIEPPPQQSRQPQRPNNQTQTVRLARQQQVAKINTQTQSSNQFTTADLQPQQIVLTNGQFHNAQIINANQLIAHNSTPIAQIVNGSTLNQLSHIIQTGNTVQMIQQNGQPAQVVQIQRTSNDDCEIVMHTGNGTQMVVHNFDDCIDPLQIDSDLTDNEDIIQICEENEIDDDQTQESDENLALQIMNMTEEEVETADVSEENDKEYIAEFISLQTTCLAPGRYVCNLCRREFKQNKWLQNHMKSHSNWIKANCKKQPQCEVCHKSFKGPGMLRMHMKTHEVIDNIPTCSICNKTFKSKTILYRHRQTHQQKKLYQCGNCMKHFSSPYTLTSHMSKKHLQERLKFKCAQCILSFVNVEMLKSHLQNTGHANMSPSDESS